jgi:hypothetical protein
MEMVKNITDWRLNAPKEPLMRTRHLTLAALCIASVVSMPAIAGTIFRLEIGSNIAGVPTLKTKNVVVMVRALACDDDASVQMTATAEGLVRGDRQSLKLELMTMPTPGVFGVRKQWSDGTWIVNVTATCPGRKATAGALVALDQHSALLRNKTKLLERAATEREVTSLLKQLAST